MANRLAGETSPYLLQHAGNPVDWYPWGPEALARARNEDRPVLLSIGYSACHWCHVMERESFEDEATAAQMNSDFVCIKVDREERPDLDAIYMAAVQQMTGSGGWPMTTFLTPGLKPFYAGTYFPPEPRRGMASFRQVMSAVSEAFQNRRQEIEASAEQVLEVIASGMATRPSDPGKDILERAADALVEQHDAAEGGFGGAPKFPHAMALDFLVRSWRRSGRQDYLATVEHSLMKMAHGGIYDHLGGGFARYSTDQLWLAPHFEKMLYDQALLATVYLHTYQVTGQVGYRDACTATIDYVLRDLCSPEGGFYSAEDADSEGVEGRFYTWSAEQVKSLLGDDYDLFSRVYDVSPEGNWEGQTILRVTGDRRQVGEQFGLDREDLASRLSRCRSVLLAARQHRVRPQRDEKVLAGWNGLMLATVAEAASALGRPDYLKAAQRNASLVLDRMYVDGRLSRTYRDGDARLNGYLEDYAAVAGGLLRLYQADFNPRWFRAAEELAEAILRRFKDPSGGILFSTSDDHEVLLFRPREFDDNAVPAGNSLAAEVFLSLHLLTGVNHWRQEAETLLAALASVMGSHPLFFGRLLSALDLALSTTVEVAIVGDLDSPTAHSMLERLRGEYAPNRVLAAAEGGANTPPILARRPAPPDGVYAYVCRGFSCDAPVSTLENLETTLA
ncbi:MAG: thioredoxin domain-containing protein [Candidatus Dormibacteria bacterium]